MTQHKRFCLAALAQIFVSQNLKYARVTFGRDTPAHPPSCAHHITRLPARIIPMLSHLWEGVFPTNTYYSRHLGHPPLKNKNWTATPPAAARDTVISRLFRRVPKRTWVQRPALLDKPGSVFLNLCPTLAETRSRCTLPSSPRSSSHRLCYPSAPRCRYCHRCGDSSRLWRAGRCGCMPGLKVSLGGLWVTRPSRLVRRVVRRVVGRGK